MDKKLRNVSILVGVFLMAIFIIGVMFSLSDNTAITGRVIADNGQIEGYNAPVETPEEKVISTGINEEETNSIEDYEDYAEEDMFPSTVELHWDHMPLTYNYYNCSQSNVDRIIKATDFITNRTEGITFRFINNQTEIPDISFICMNERKMEYGDKYVTNIFAEAVPYVYKGLNVYAPSQILIYSINSCPYGRPTTEIHEILHLLGLQHPKYAYEDDIMNLEHIGCTTDITEEELGYLKSIYD